MKFSVLALLLLFSCTEAKISNDNDLKREKLKGRVKSITEKTFGATESFGETKKGDLYYQTIDKYDDKGNLIEILNGSDNKDGEKFINKYDGNGNRIEFCGYNLRDSLETRWTYKYDTKNNKIEDCCYKGVNNLESKVLYKYDNKNNNIEESSYNSDGSLKSKKSFIYDDNGNQIQVNSLNSFGNIGIESTSKYNEKGKTIEYCYCREDGSCSVKTFYMYDKNAFKIEETVVIYGRKDPTAYSDMLNRITYKYDEMGSLTEESSYYSHVNYIFGEKRDPPPEKLNSTKSYSYEYDKIGNWIKKVEKADIKQPTVKEREIEYF